MIGKVNQVGAERTLGTIAGGLLGVLFYEVGTKVGCHEQWRGRLSAEAALNLQQIAARLRSQTLIRADVTHATCAVTTPLLQLWTEDSDGVFLSVAAALVAGSSAIIGARLGLDMSARLYVSDAWRALPRQSLSALPPCRRPQRRHRRPAGLDY